MVNVKRYNPKLEKDIGLGLPCMTMQENFFGSWVTYEDYASLQQKLDAMAAENAAQSTNLKALATLNNRLWQWTSRMSYNASYVGEPEGLVKGHIREMEKIIDGAANKTPATYAYLNSVRAEGVEMFANKITKTVSDEGKPDSHHAYAYIAMNFADKLRSGTHNTADKEI